MRYDSQEKRIYISYKTKVKGTEKVLEFDKKPIIVQLHPHKPGEVVRAHFKGTYPSWFASYAFENGYYISSISTPSGAGFSLQNQGYKEKYLTCPLVRGQIVEWFKAIQGDRESFDTFRDKLLDHIEIVEKNLKYFAEDFKKYGLHYRLEEFEGKYGALYLVKHLVPESKSYSQLSASNQKKWVELVDSLILEREYPFEEMDEEIITIELDTDLTVLEEEPTAQEAAEEELEVLEEEPTAQEAAEEELEVLEEEPAAQEAAGEELEVLEEEPAAQEATEEELEVLEEEQPHTEAVKELFLSGSVQVASRNSKKEGIIVGQALLF